MGSELQIIEFKEIIDASELPSTKVDNLLTAFGKFYQQAKKIVELNQTIRVTDEGQTDLMDKAKLARRQLKDIRVEAEKKRKEMKEQSLREGKAIDGIANVLKALIVPVEEHLEKQEKFAEELEKARKAEKLAKRQEELNKYVSDITLYNLSDMSTETYEKLLDSSKSAFFAQQEAEKRIETEKIAKEKEDAIQREKIKAENEMLKKEAQEKENLIAEERKKVAEDRLKQEAQLKREREERKKLEREKIEKEEAEKKIIAEKMEKERQLSLAPEKQKLISLAEEFEKIMLPVMTTEKGKIAVKDVGGMIGRLGIFIRQRANTL